MRAFAAFVVSGFRRWATYRLATAAGAFTNSVFGLIKANVMVAAIGAAGGTLAGYDAASGATYAWLTQALLSPVSMFQWDELAQRVRTGDIAVDLARPVDPQLAFLAADLGRAAHAVIPRGAPPLLVGALAFGLLLPSTPLPYLLGVVSVVLAVVVSFACRWLVNLAAFWLIEVRGVLILYLVAANLLAGFLVPIHWFPGWMARLAALTPFPSMLQAPLDVLTGRVEGTAALAVVGVQALWAAGLLAAGRLVFAAGTRTLVVQGG